MFEPCQRAKENSKFRISNVMIVEDVIVSPIDGTWVSKFIFLAFFSFLGLILGKTTRKDYSYCISGNSIGIWGINPKYSGVL